MRQQITLKFVVLLLVAEICMARPNHFLGSEVKLFYSFSVFLKIYLFNYYYFVGSNEK
jgi:hypothetical protein